MRATTLTLVRSLALNPPPDRPVTNESVEALVRKEGARVWRSLKYLGVAEADLADACQEVFLVVHRRLDDFRGESRIDTWLYGICLGVARNLRRKRTTQNHVSLDAWDDAVEPSQESELERDRARAALCDALGQIPVEQREVFVLHEVEELEMSRVAELLGCRLFTAYSRLRLARRALARRLDAYRRKDP